MLSAALAIVILLPSNITIINAQQPPPSSQPAVNQNQPSSPMFQSTEDSFRVRVPEGWVVRDVHNTGFMLLSEVLQGYGDSHNSVQSSKNKQQVVLAAIPVKHLKEISYTS